MERHSKMSQNKKEGFEKRSPLQHLNGLQIRKPICKKTSNLSFEASNGCPRLLPSSNSSTASSSSSSSRTHFQKKPINLPTVTKNASLEKKSAVTLKPRSKENEIVPKKPFSQKPMKNQPPCLDKKHSGKASIKPTIKKVHQSSKLCSARKNPVKVFNKGSERFEPKLKNSEEISSGELPIKLFENSHGFNLDCIENCTPEDKLASVSCGLDSLSFDYPHIVKEDLISKTGNGENSDTSVKTPPVEASVSPEMQSVSHSKILVAKSTATPVCYGAAGHLLSGVTDKRRCRRRGTLRVGGFEKINLFDDDEKNYENVESDSRGSLIPLPGEASVRWVLCDEGRENVYDFGCDSKQESNSASSFGSLSSGNIIRTPSSDSGSYGCNSGPNVDSGSYGCKVDLSSGISFAQVQKNNFASSFVSLSGGNIIRTPSSDSGSYGCNSGPNVDSGSYGCKVDLSSGGSFARVQENTNSVCSWVSDSTLLESLALSETRVSWRDGFVSSVFENDEFDCCRCLSDEDIDVDVCFDKWLCPISRSGGERENDLVENGCLRSCLGTGCGENEESDPRICGDEYEPRVLERVGKDKSSSSNGLNASAESICTNGGELVASGDSDWMYFRENDVFRTK